MMVTGYTIPSKMWNRMIIVFINADANLLPQNGRHHEPSREGLRGKPFLE